jgi:hypothetical protein
VFARLRALRARRGGQPGGELPGGPGGPAGPAGGPPAPVENQQAIDTKAATLVERVLNRTKLSQKVTIELEIAPDDRDQGSHDVDFDTLKSRCASYGITVDKIEPGPNDYPLVTITGEPPFLYDFLAKYYFADDENEGLMADIQDTWPQLAKALLGEARHDFDAPQEPLAIDKRSLQTHVSPDTEEYYSDYALSNPFSRYFIARRRVRPQPRRRIPVKQEAQILVSNVLKRIRAQ